MIKRFLYFLALLVIIDIYLLNGYKNFNLNSSFKIAFKWFYYASLLVSYSCFALIIIKFDDRPTQSTLWMNLWFGYTFAFLVLKMVLFLGVVLDDLIRGIEYLSKAVWNLMSQPSTKVAYPDRRKFIGQLGLGLASVPFLGMLYGITKGKYNYKLKSVSLDFSNLPRVFDGLKIVHISDIHSGSFDDIEAVAQGVNMIKEQEADLVLFTGDLVNNDAEEIVPYKELFGGVQAPLGVFSTLGNHDYGTHKRWKSKEDKYNNLSDLKAHQKEMGFDLLNNRTHTIVKEGQALDIVGVENWGKPPFPQLGDLDKALEGTNPNHFKILLSHDPTHWDEKVIPNAQKIDLTLSGHTHGMQFGVEIPGFKWSPSKYIYKRWAGLYQNKEQFLYVNRGFGFLGFPGRVGIWPEITVITLNRKG